MSLCANGSGWTKAALGRMSKSAARVVSPEEYGEVPGGQSRDSVPPGRPAPKSVDLNALLPYAAALGSGLLAYNASDAIVGESDESDSAWKRLVKKLIPLGVGAAGVYGGYRLGSRLSKAAQDNRFSIGDKVVEFDDPAAIRGGRRLFKRYANPIDPANIDEESDKGNFRTIVEGALGGASAWGGGKALFGKSRGPGADMVGMRKQVDDAFKKWRDSLGKETGRAQQENLKQIWEELATGKTSPRTTPSPGKIYEGPSLAKMEKIDLAKRIGRRFGLGALGFGTSAALLWDAYKSLSRGNEARKFIQQWNDAK